MEKKEQETVPEIQFNVVTDEDGKPKEIEFVAEPKYEVEKLVQDLPERLINGKVGMQLPKIGQVREIAFIDNENRIVVVVPMTHKQSVTIDELFASEEKERSFAIDGTMRYLTPSFRLSPAE